jgi:aminoglycoside 3-N-acetyltransferase I
MDLLSENIRIKQLGKKDIQVARQLFILLQEVFEIENSTELTESYLQKLLANPAFIVFVAYYKNEIAGGLTAYILPMTHSECNEAYVYDIAVKPGFQRKGLGKRLLSAIKEYCRQNRITKIFVQANEKDKYALDFYRGTNANEENVIHFTYEQPELKN